MVVGFFGLLLGVFYLGVVIFMLWLGWHAVAALEQSAVAQERSANTLAEISDKYAHDGNGTASTTRAGGGLQR